MSRNEQDCREACPYKDAANFDELISLCRGLKVRLDKHQFAVRNGVIVGEVTDFACGSSPANDKITPTISLQDWMDTDLSVSELESLWRHGVLPDQMQ